MSLNMREMNEDQKKEVELKFVHAYRTNGGNATQAARDVGVEGNYAENFGCRMKKKLMGDNAIKSDGVFYILDLIPDVPTLNRVKFGFTSNMDNRLEQHRTSAPTAKILGTFQCKRAWEQAAIDVCSRGEHNIRTEIYDVRDVDTVLNRAQQFFNMMPEVTSDS